MDSSQIIKEKIEEDDVIQEKEILLEQYNWCVVDEEVIFEEKTENKKEEQDKILSLLWNIARRYKDKLSQKERQTLFD